MIFQGNARGKKQQVTVTLLQFTRAIRKIALSALSAASQLFLLMKWRSLRIFMQADFHASMKSAHKNMRVNCDTNIPYTSNIRSA